MRDNVFLRILAVPHTDLNDFFSQRMVYNTLELD